MGFRRLFALGLDGRAVYCLPAIGPREKPLQAVLMSSLSESEPFWVVLGTNGCAASFETLEEALDTATNIVKRNQAPFMIVIDFSEAFDADDPFDVDPPLYSVGIFEEGYCGVAIEGVV